MVYFIGNKQNKVVKIGYTISKIDQRVSVIQANCPFIIECMLLIEGLKDTEQYLHKLFKDEWIRGEWFKLEGEVEKYLNNPTKIPIDETFTPTPRKDRVSQTNIDIERLYGYGHSYREIADKLGYTQSQVRTFIERRQLVNKYNGIRRRKKYVSNHVRTPKTIILPPITKLV